jgi:MerR family mercuric resistance operon transcriptional regulator
MLCPMKTRGAAGDGEKRSIGQLAKAAGVNIETVRYYHRRGLIPLPPKRVGGRRNYPDSALRQIAFIRRAQQLGFTLEEIGVLLKIADGGECSSAKAMAERKLEELDARAEMLNRMRRDLSSLVKKCAANDGSEPCAVIRAIDGEI